MIQSHERMKFVREQRLKTLGKEHPYTLLTVFYLAQLKSTMGQQYEAERMMRELIPVAESKVSEGHTLVLALKAHYARVLVRLGRFEEAEEIFHTLIQKSWWAGASDEDGDHPDRISALWFLSGCLEVQGKYQEALEVCMDMVMALQQIGGKGRGVKHKFTTTVLAKIAELKTRVSDDVRDRAEV